MASNNISVHINLAGLTSAAQRNLQRAMHLVSIGLQAEATPEKIAEGLPDAAVVFQFASNEPWTVQRASDEWARWILSNGFRDAAESLAALLEEARTVLALWSLQKLQQAQGVLTGGEWRRAMMDDGRSFHRLGFPDKLAKIEKQYGLCLEEDLINRILSIVKARNCLVHRAGVVTSHDATSGAGLELKWRTLAVILTGPTGEREVELPAVAEAGTTVAVGVRPRSKTFGPGATITVTSAEFAQVCWTLFLFAVELAKALEVRGRALGFEFSQNAGTA